MALKEHWSALGCVLFVNILFFPNSPRPRYMVDVACLSPHRLDLMVPITEKLCEQNEEEINEL